MQQRNVDMVRRGGMIAIPAILVAFVLILLFEPTVSVPMIMLIGIAAVWYGSRCTAGSQ
jgi:hypothetical protein